MKNMTVIGTALGLLFALVVAVGGFWGFIGALIFGFIGGVIGAHLEERIDLRAFLDAFSSGRGGRG